jgi:electron transport complex protein RnfE
MSATNEFTKGIVRENPVFALLLGLCPTLAVTTSLKNGVGMGLAGGAVLICSNIVISLLRNVIPPKIRIPIFIVIIASFVTVVDLMMEANIPELHKSLGLFIPLIVVNCIILGRAEAYAYKQGVLNSALDGLGMTVGFTWALALIGGIREILGTGNLWGMPWHIALGSIPVAGHVLGPFARVISDILGGIGVQPAILMILPPGAFILMGVLMGWFQNRKLKKEAGL